MVCSVYCQRSQGIGRKCQCHWHFTPISLSIQSQCWQDSPWLSFQHLTQGTWYFQVEFITFCFQRVAAAGCPLHSSFCEAEKTMLFPVPQVDLFFFFQNRRTRHSEVCKLGQLYTFFTHIKTAKIQMQELILKDLSISLVDVWTFSPLMTLITFCVQYIEEILWQRKQICRDSWDYFFKEC